MFIVGPLTSGSEAQFRFHESGIYRYFNNGHIKTVCVTNPLHLCLAQKHIIVQIAKSAGLLPSVPLMSNTSNAYKYCLNSQNI